MRHAPVFRSLCGLAFRCRVGHLGLAATIGLALLISAAPAPCALYAQQTSAAAISQDSLAAYVRAYAAIAVLRDRIHNELADPKTKKGEVLEQVREKLRAQIAQVLKEQGLTESFYQHVTHAISVDAEQRKRFEQALAELTVKKD
ncbi:MAG: DUF4168 domain-containing protein [Gemmatimonadaceae bacterium]|nr:DUF4168 domain-containing protein [Gemmatimonadaceae bacterium]